MDFIKEFDPNLDRKLKNTKDVENLLDFIEKKLRKKEKYGTRA